MSDAAGVVIDNEVFHMCERMEVNARVFEVRRLLGKGKGGYSYLVEDPSNGALFVAKQIHHEQCDYYSFGDKLESEIRDYNRLAEIGLPMPSLVDVDVGCERILKQYIPGRTILEHIVAGSMDESFLEQVKSMCRLVHRAGLNIDYFPTNFVVDDGSVASSNAGRLFYIDYECNEYMERWDFEHWGIKYWSMTPELEEYLSSRPDAAGKSNESPEGENI